MDAAHLRYGHGRRSREERGVHETTLRVIADTDTHQIGKLVLQILLGVLAVVQATVVVLQNMLDELDGYDGVSLFLPILEDKHNRTLAPRAAPQEARSRLSRE